MARRNYITHYDHFIAIKHNFFLISSLSHLNIELEFLNAIQIFQLAEKIFIHEKPVTDTLSKRHR